MYYITCMYYFVVLLPRSTTKFLEAKFGIQVLDRESMLFFERTFEDIIKTRQQDPDNASNFIQSVSNKIVEAPKGDPDTIIDSFGSSWTRKGKCYEYLAD